MPTLTENIDRINHLSKELNVSVRFDGDTKQMFIKNDMKGWKRIRRVCDLSMENIEKAMYWVAGKSVDH